jgi:hypothetical protein
MIESLGMPATEFSFGYRLNGRPRILGAGVHPRGPGSLYPVS